MYARSYEKHTGEEEHPRMLPSGYSGIAFENEAAEPLPQGAEHCREAEECGALHPQGTCAEEKEGPLAPLLSRIPLLQKFNLPRFENFTFGSLFSETEDLLLLGLFLLLLFSREGDSLCAVAILILFFTGKD